jgi:hypothetical protein
MLKWSGALAALAMMACASTPSPAAQGARLMAQMKAASGGAKLDALTTYHSTGTAMRDGRIAGVSEDWGDFHTMAFSVIETFGGVTTSGGFDGRQGWSRGPDGTVRIGATPEALAGARLNAYLNTRAYFWPERFPAAFEYKGRQEADGKAYDVVAVTPEETFTINLWLDPRTHRLARLTGTNGRANFTGVVETERNVDGVWIMATGIQTMTAGSETHTETYSIQSFAFEPVPPERLQTPRS